MAVTAEELHQEFKEELEEVFRAELATLRAGIKADFTTELMLFSEMLPTHVPQPLSIIEPPTAAAIAKRRQSRVAANPDRPRLLRGNSTHTLMGRERTELTVESYQSIKSEKRLSTASHNRLRSNSIGRRKSLAGSLLADLAISKDALTYPDKLGHHETQRVQNGSKQSPAPVKAEKKRDSKRSLFEKAIHAFDSSEKKKPKKVASLPDIAFAGKRKSNPTSQDIRVVSVIPAGAENIEVTDWDADETKSNDTTNSDGNKDGNVESEASSETHDGDEEEVAVLAMSETAEGGTCSQALTTVLTGASMPLSEDSRSSWAKARGSYQQRLRRIVISGYFDFVATCLVILNAAVIGIQADYTVRNLRDPIPTSFRIIETVFCVIFAIELAIRVAACGRYFLLVPEWRWNLFDTFIVGVQLVEEVSALVVGHESLFGTRSFGNNVGFIRILRVLRLIRIMKVVRLLRFIQELRTMVCSMAASMKSLLWTLVLLFLLIYVMAVYLTQMIVDHGHTSNRSILTEDSRAIGKYYGSLARALLSLFQGITGGIDWNDLVDPLMDNVTPMAGVAFTLFISFAVLAMMNVVTGIFVESALLTAKADKDSELANHVRRIFAKSDVDLDGQISWEEFSDQLDNPALEKYFKVLEIDVSEARGLFMLLDTDESGTIDAEEFVMGILRLRGNAKAIDLATLMYFNKRMMAWWKEWKCTVDEDLFEILEKLGGGVHQFAHQSEAPSGFAIGVPSASVEETARRKRHSDRKQTPGNEAGLFATWADLKGEAERKVETRKRDLRKNQRHAISKFSADGDDDAEGAKPKKKTVGFVDTVASKLTLPNFHRPNRGSATVTKPLDEDEGGAERSSVAIVTMGSMGSQSSLESGPPPAKSATISFFTPPGGVS